MIKIFFVEIYNLTHKHVQDIYEIHVIYTSDQFFF